MYKIRRLQPESHSRMKRGSSEMPPRVAKLQKKTVTQSISSGFFRFSYKKTSIIEQTECRSARTYAEVQPIFNEVNNAHI